jgi:hypothetical protein
MSQTIKLVVAARRRDRLKNNHILDFTKSGLTENKSLSV